MSSSSSAAWPSSKPSDPTVGRTAPAVHPAAGSFTRQDVVVIGAGPAGSALAAALVAAGLDVVLIGDDEPWPATYGAWIDDLDGLGLLDGADIWAHRLETIEVATRGRRSLRRAYGVIDNDRLRSALRARCAPLIDRVASVEPTEGPTAVLTHTGLGLAARVVVDATGSPARFVPAAEVERRPPMQTAFGVVLATAPDGPLGSPTLMDFSELPPGGDDDLGALGIPTFAYSLPVADGWLVEETVLAADPAVDPDRLVDRLARRLGIDAGLLLDRALRVERVSIPMGGSFPDRSQPLLAYGAAAGMVHPATGYSVSASLRDAPTVAARLADILARSNESPPPEVLWDAIWPVARRRTRRLNDYGLDVLVTLDEAGVRAFFDAFFALPVERWATYLRSDAEPREVAAVMTSLFRAAPWALRRRLVSSNPRAFARLLRA